MSGVAIIRALLIASPAVVSAVPAARIKAGPGVMNDVAPLILLEQISSVPRLTVAMIETNRLHTDRVQVSVLLKGPSGTPAGNGYPGVKALLNLILAACPNTHGTVAGFSCDSVLPDAEQIGAGDIEVDAALFSGSRDFIVKWCEA